VDAEPVCRIRAAQLVSHRERVMPWSCCVGNTNNSSERAIGIRRQMMEPLTATSERVTDTPAIEILLVDEQLIFCEGLTKLFEGEPGFTVVASTCDPDRAAQLADAHKPDIVMVGLTGRPLLRLLQMLQERTAAGNPARIIVLTTALEKAHLFQLPRSGVSGILLEQTSPQVLFESVRSVVAGYCWLGRERLHDLAEGLQPLSPANRNRFGLTPRELEIAEAVRRGETNRTIARRLSVTHYTVKHHLTNIFTKVGVSSRLQLAVFAIDHDLSQGLRAGEHPPATEGGCH
jgi:two-component system, NarL family, nitrate/nitrite response regulator NarL